MTSTASTDRGETTIGPANSACALIGTSSSASTSGQTTGPPAENAYAVEPVGVAQTTPSHAHRDSGRPSISVTTSIIRSRAAFSTLASFSAQVPAVTVAVLPHRHLDRHPLFYRVPVLHDLVDGAGQVVGLGLGEEPDMAEVDAEQRRARGPGHLRRPQQRAVAAEHDHHLGVLGRVRRRGRTTSAPAQRRSAASGSRTRTADARRR